MTSSMSFKEHTLKFGVAELKAGFSGEMDLSCMIDTMLVQQDQATFIHEVPCRLYVVDQSGVMSRPCAENH